MKTRFFIPCGKIKGPFNLKSTICSGQTSQPAWETKDGYFQTLLKMNGEPFKVGVTQNPKDLSLEVIIEPEDDQKIEKCIMEILSLNDDLNAIYRFFRKDQYLNSTLGFCKGLRIFKASDIFECLISSITSANNSVKRWNHSIHLIKQKFGEKFEFSDGTLYSHPKPENLIELTENDLTKCGVGYRAKYILKASKMVSDEINLHKIGKMDYKSAKDTLMLIPGVGHKVADCILLYGYGFGLAFPVDVWIRRIVKQIYFGKKCVSDNDIRKSAVDRFGEYAGYAQLYLFCYARGVGF